MTIVSTIRHVARRLAEAPKLGLDLPSMEKCAAVWLSHNLRGLHNLNKWEILQVSALRQYGKQVLSFALEATEVGESCASAASADSLLLLSPKILNFAKLVLIAKEVSDVRLPSQSILGPQLGA
jgi:hypothetical protein